MSAETKTERGDEFLLRGLFPSRPLQWVGSALALALMAGAGAFAVIASGVANVSAIPPHPEGWARLLHFASSRSFAAHANKTSPPESLDSPALIMTGATEYALVCSNCHGAPGFGQSPVALSMRPEPPMILDAATNYSDGELFYVVQNGVRYTGMPAWPVTNRPEEIWAMVAFIKAMRGMDAETYTRLARGALDGATPSSPVAFHPATNAVRTVDTSIGPFVASNAERPYLPGDPQNGYSSPAATLFPRVGFGTRATSGDPMSGCVACHGADGAGRPGGAFPNLTLQSPQYIYDALRAFATGQRQSGIMWPIAANLTDADMRTIASRLGGASPVSSPPVPGGDGLPPTERDRGESISDYGVPRPGITEKQGESSATSSVVERCTSCHFQLTGLGRIIPQINGQNAAYLRTQLRAFRGEGRGDTGGYDPMSADSHRLSDSDIRAVSEYYASVPPVAKK